MKNIWTKQGRIRLALAALGLALLAAGLAMGAWQRVLGRAALVCMECIGLG